MSERGYVYLSGPFCYDTRSPRWDYFNGRYNLISGEGPGSTFSFFIDRSNSWLLRATIDGRFDNSLSGLPYQLDLSVQEGALQVTLSCPPVFILSFPLNESTYYSMRGIKELKFEVEDLGRDFFVARIMAERKVELVCPKPWINFPRDRFLSLGSLESALSILEEINKLFQVKIWPSGVED